MPPANADGTVALDKFGLGVVLDKASATTLAKFSRELTAAPVLPAGEMLQPRGDLRATGLITSVHLQAARDASIAQLATVNATLEAGKQPTLSTVLGSSSSQVIDSLIAAATKRSGEVGFLVEPGPSVTVRTLGLRGGGDLVVLTPSGMDNIPIARLDTRLRGSTRDIGDLVGRLPAGAIDPLPEQSGGTIVRPDLVTIRPGNVDLTVVRPEGRGAVGPLATPPPAAGTTVTMPPLAKDAAVIARYESAVAELVGRTVLGVDPVMPSLVPFAIRQAVIATMDRTNPVIVHPARLDTMISVAGHGLAKVLADPSLAPEWRLPTLWDRVMAYPRLDLAAYTYLAAYDRTRFCPGVDEVPPESITLLETNPRFIAAFMAGLNHETNKELLWRSYPTDGRGTPWRKFWKRTDNGPDIFEIHTWSRRGGREDLPAQTTDLQGSLVLLLRGDLLRRYPNTMAVAVRAVSVSGGQKPSVNPADVLTPVFAGQFDPDVSFFGFPLVSADLTAGEGWFFGLMEPVTEPRFGFDETVGRETPTPTTWNDVAWPDLGVAPAGQLKVSQLAAMGLMPAVGQADGVAAALFQRPFKLLVHARHLVEGI
jgi:hypothetical protein